nr:MMPL family transporter [Lachnospiraceae bacterium]
GAMLKISAFIVDKRMLFFLIYVIALIFSFFATNWVQVQNDIKTYLSDNTETKKSIKLMDEEFVTLGKAQVMVASVTFDESLELKKKIEALDGVYSVDYTTETDDDVSFKKHYNNGSALFTVNFNYSEKDEKSLKSLSEVEKTLEGYDIYVSTTMGNQQADAIEKEMKPIIMVVAVVVLCVLLFTCLSFGEIPVLLITFIASILIHKGTNFLLGEISFVSNSVSAILQLAMSIDYAVILCNHYKELHQTMEVRDAAVVALSKSIPEIMGSSLTTISGMVALIFMQFKLGGDLGVVLIKAILISLLTVFTLMPGLLVVFAKAMDKTAHRSFVPKITFIGKFAWATRYIIPIAFGVVFVFAFIGSQKCPYVYGNTLVETPVKNETQIASDMITDNFGSYNQLAVLVPGHDYDAEKGFLDEISKRPEVYTAQGLANQGAYGYNLTDALRPRQISEALGIDVELVDLLYMAYAADKDDFGRVIVGVTNYRIPLMDLVEFLHTKVDEGYVEINDATRDKINGIYTKVNFGRMQLEGESYDRILLTLHLPEESEETYAFISDVREIAAKYYPKEEQVVYLAGLSTNALDLKQSFARDNVVVNILTALFVLIILLFTFKSAGLPLLQILVIEGAIFINFSLPGLLHENLFFLSYLIVSSIQMGANIDYAIVISSRFIEERKTKGPKESIIEALNFAFPTIVTSGTMMAIAGFAIGSLSSQASIVGVGLCLGRGTLISIALVLFVLPQILLFGDKLIEITTFDIYRPIKLRKAEGSIYIDGTVKGTVNGTISGYVKGTVKGDVGVTLVNGSMENIPPDLLDDVEKAVEKSKEIREKEEAEKNASPPSLMDKLKGKLKAGTKDKQDGEEEGGEKNEND